jgi:hypothetical protein
VQQPRLLLLLLLQRLEHGNLQQRLALKLCQHPGVPAASS